MRRDVEEAPTTVGRGCVPGRRFVTPFLPSGLPLVVHRRIAPDIHHPQRRLAEEPVAGPAPHDVLLALRVDPELECRVPAVQRTDAVADPVVAAVLRRGEADARRSHEAASHRQPVADLAVEPVALPEAPVRHPRHRLAAPQSLGPAPRLTAPRRRHLRREAERRRRRRVVAEGDDLVPTRALGELAMSSSSTAPGSWRRGATRR